MPTDQQARDQIAALMPRVTALESRMAAAEARLSSAEVRLADLEASADDAEAMLDDHEARITALEHPVPPPPPPPPPPSVSLLTQADFTYLGHYRVASDLGGAQLVWGQGFTHRYVNGQLRFLTLGFLGNQVPSPQEQYSLLEFSVPAAYGDRVTTTTGQWAHLWNGTGWGRNGWWMGVWWDEPQQRLWTTSAVDYPDDTMLAWTRSLWTRTLNANGTISNLRGYWGLPGVNQRQVHGGVCAVPTWFQTQYGTGPYAVGFGGYASRMNVGVSLGPTLYTVPEPSATPDGQEFPAASVRRLMAHGHEAADWYVQGTPGAYDRGLRNADVLNYYDGGDPRPNPQTPPTAPPAAGAQWQIPAPDGLGRWVWGDSAWGTGVWIDTPTKRGFVLAPSFSSGKAYYMSSTLNRDRYSYELQVFDPAHFGEVLAGTRPAHVPPTSRWRIDPLPGFTPTTVTSGLTLPKGIAGATFDATMKRLYLYATWADDGDSRIFVYQVTA